MRLGVFLALFQDRHFVASCKFSCEYDDVAKVHGEERRVVGKIVVVLHNRAEQKIFFRLPHQMKDLAENQKDVERAPRSQNRKVGVSFLRSERDDCDFERKPCDQDANRKPVDEIEIRGEREHHREKNRAADERGIYLPPYGKPRFRICAPQREHEDRHESERRHDVGEMQEKFCLREVVPKKRGRDAFHAKLVDEK